MALSWRLLLPALPGKQEELEALEGQIDELAERFAAAEPSEQPALDAALTALIEERVELTEPTSTIAKLAGSDVTALPPIPADVEIAGPFAFDASFLDDEEMTWLPDDVLEEAHQRHDAAAMLAYKQRLLVALAENPEALAEDLDEDGKLAVGMIVMTATWLDFWGKRNFGFEPLYS